MAERREELVLDAIGLALLGEEEFSMAIEAICASCTAIDLVVGA